MASPSEVLDPKHWQGQPHYFFKSLKPRVSRYAQRADDACLQAQVDTFGSNDVGAIAGSLAPTGNFASLIYAESSPDRLPILAYLNEMLSFYEGFEDQMAEMMGSALDDANRVPKDPKFNNPEWQTRFKSALMKIVGVLSTQDQELGGKCLVTLKELAECPYLGPKMDAFKSLDEYLDDRYLDIAWPSLFACAQYGAGLHLTVEQEKSLETVFKPLWMHSCCAYDYFTWEKELKEAKALGPEHKIVNAITLLGRLEGKDLSGAREVLKERCFAYEAEYLKQKKEYLKTHSWESLSPEVQTWFTCQEDIATGFALWNATTYRHVPPYGEAYKSFYTRRVSEGATYLEDAGASQSLLSGGFEVRVNSA